MLEKIVKLVKISPKAALTCGLGLGAIAVSLRNGILESELGVWPIASVAIGLGIRNWITEYRIYKTFALRVKLGGNIGEHDLGDDNIRRYVEIAKKYEKTGSQSEEEK